MSSVKVSICVSVHNTSVLLPRCLDSLVNQTLKEIEIVLVNNGSTDNSEDIMIQYKKKYPHINICIFSQEDKGLAQGRQTGLNNAHGDYIAVLDADDYVLPKTYELLYETAVKTQSDIVEMESMRDGQVISTSLEGIHDSHKVLEYYFEGLKGIKPMMWLRLYKSTLFSKPVLPLLYTNNEDVFAFPCLLYKANSIFFLKEKLHVYSTDNEQGVMKRLTTDISYSNRFYNSRKVVLKCVKHIKNYIGEENMSNSFNAAFQKFKSNLALEFIFMDFRNVSYSERHHAVETEFDISKSELDNLIRNYIPVSVPHTSPIYYVIKFLGVKPAYLLHQLANKHKH